MIKIKLNLKKKKKKSPNHFHTRSRSTFDHAIRSLHSLFVFLQLFNGTSNYCLLLNVSLSLSSSSLSLIIMCIYIYIQNSDQLSTCWEKGEEEKRINRGFFENFWLERQLGGGWADVVWWRRKLKMLVPFLLLLLLPSFSKLSLLFLTF